MRGRAKVYADFSAGLNLKAGSRALGPNETDDALNVRSERRGPASKRPGDSNLTSVATGTGIISFSVLPIPGSGASILIVNTDTDDLSTSQFGNPPTALGSVGTGAIWSWAVAPETGGQGPFYGLGDNLARYINAGGTAIGTWTASSGTLPSDSALLVYHGNRLWAAGEALAGTVGSNLYFSDLGNPRAWPAANIVQFDPGDGLPITAIAPLGPYLVVFKRNKAWLVYDLDTGANRPIGGGVGCVAPRSCVEMPEGLIFLSPDQGFMLTTGGEPRPLSDNLKPLLDEIRGADTFNTVVAGCHAARFGRSYVAAFEHPAEYSVKGRSEQATILEYDFTTEAWWKHSGRSSLIAAGSTNTLGERLYAACRTGRQIDSILDGSGNGKAAGTAFDSLYSTAYLPLGVARGRLRHATLQGDGQFGIRVSRDHRDVLVRDVAEAAVGALGGSGEYGRRVSDLGVAEAVRLQVYNETLGQPMRLDSVTLWSDGRRD